MSKMDQRAYSMRLRIQCSCSQYLKSSAEYFETLNKAIRAAHFISLKLTAHDFILPSLTSVKATWSEFLPMICFSPDFLSFFVLFLVHIFISYIFLYNV